MYNQVLEILFLPPTCGMKVFTSLLCGFYILRRDKLVLGPYNYAVGVYLLNHFPSPNVASLQSYGLHFS